MAEYADFPSLELLARSIKPLASGAISRPEDRFSHEIEQWQGFNRV